MSCCIDDVVGMVLQKIFDCLFESIGREIGYSVKYKENIENLEKEVNDLKGVRDSVQAAVNRARDNGMTIEKDAEKWLEEVQQSLMTLEEEVNNSLQDGTNLKCLDVLSRYRLGKKGKRLAMDAIELKENHNKFGDKVAHPTPLKDIWDTSSTSYEQFSTRTSIFAEIMKALRDEKNSKIGIYGMAGVGKTTMVEEVGKQVGGKGPFDEVAMAVFSQNPDLKKIQGKLADCLNLTLNRESEEGRAGQLSNRLKNGKKILVILDDVWDDQITLKKIGIPTDIDSMGCKILLTSRRLEVCKQMGFEKNFPIGLLSRPEAWHLFKRMVGDFIEDNPQIHSVAQQVCRECDHLPLAICAVGGALSGLDDKHIWNDALEQLKHGQGYKIDGVEEKVYSCIEWSYRYLKRADVQSCFLHCSLFPEDTEIAIDLLVPLGVGTKFLGSIDRASMKKARDRTLVIVGILKKSNLLLECRDGNKVKMHDVVRDVAISIASKDKDAHLVQDGVNVWPDKDDYTFCKAISLRASCNLRRLPDRLECFELRTLVLGSSDASLLELPISFFEGMKRLEVLVLNKMKLVPSSLSHLVGLRMLCLSDCELMNLSFIKELKNLEILVIGYIYKFKEVVMEIGQFTCLRLLDLREFNEGIGFSSGLLTCLSNLEELYIMKEYNGWEVEGNASIDEINCLTSLTALDIYIPKDFFLLLPKDLPSFQLLTKYKIWIGSPDYFSVLEEYTETKVLGLDGIPLIDGLDVLIANAEGLYFGNLEGLKKVLHDRDGEWFSDLKFLAVGACEDMEHLLGKPKWSSKTHGPSPLCSFGKLEFLFVGRCKSIKYLFSASTARCLPKLHELDVRDCEALQEIIEGDEEVTDKVIFHRLKKLKLSDLPNLISIYADTKKTSTIESSTSSTVTQPLFNEKVMFPVLEELLIENLDSIKEICLVVSCRSMKYLFSASTARCLPKLHELIVRNCEALEEIIGGDEEVTDKVIFHELKILKLENLPNLRSIWQSSTTECSLPLFNEKVKFPVLEQLRIFRLDSIKAIWDKQLLLVLNARDSFQHLQILHVEFCEEMEEILAFEVGQGEEAAESNDEIPMFPHLKTILLDFLPNLKDSRLQALVNHKVRFPSLKHWKIRGRD